MADRRHQEESRAKARKIAVRLGQLIVTFALTRFWTFTFFASVPDHLRMKHWHRFMMALRKHHPKLDYFLIKEPHKSGKLHFHVLFGEYVSWHLVRRLWVQAECGKVVHVVGLDKGGIERYITKYLTKSIADKERGTGTAYSSSRAYSIHLASFPKWVMKLFSLGLTDIIEFLLDKFDFSMYYRVAGRAKRLLMYEVQSISVAIEGV